MAFITTDAKLLHELENAKILAETDIPFLIVGETGTGKELLAKHIHEFSNRRGGNFVAINCAGIPEALLEAELFGVMQGAHSTAHRSRAGLLRHAHTGTLFLDEIGDMPYTLQAKLLRVLQERMVRPVGGNVEFPIDIRLISATNRDILQLTYSNTFRSDLFYRINGEMIYLSPLRERPHDIIPIARGIDEEYSKQLYHQQSEGMTAEVEEWLTVQQWNGNVRQMQYPILRGRKLANTKPMELKHIRKYATEEIQAKVERAIKYLGNGFNLTKEMRAIESVYVSRALDAADGNKPRLRNY